MRARATKMLAALLLAAIASVGATGCDALITLRVMIPDYESSAVSGLRVWLREEGRSSFQPIVDVDLEEVVEKDGEEWILYRIEDAGAGGSFSVGSRAYRASDHPDALELMLLVPVDQRSGALRLSTLNAAGESALSSAEAAI